MWNYTRSSGSYRSGLEKSVRDYLDEFGIIYGYETEKIIYTIPSTDHTYTPDFVFYKLDGTRMYIETKGLWDAKDRKKFFYIKKEHPNLDLRFIFSNFTTPIRKGSKTTYADVCNGKLRGHNDFKVPYSGTLTCGRSGIIPVEWLREVKINIAGQTIDQLHARKIDDGKKRYAKQRPKRRT